MQLLKSIFSFLWALVPVLTATFTGLWGSNSRSNSFTLQHINRGVKGKSKQLASSQKDHFLYNSTVEKFDRERVSLQWSVFCVTNKVIYTRERESKKVNMNLVKVKLCVGDRRKDGGYKQYEHYLICTQLLFIVFWVVITLWHVYHPCSIDRMQKEQQRSVIRFVWSEGVKTGEMYGRLTAQHGYTCMRQREVYGWVERFKGEWTGVDGARSGRPSAVTVLRVSSRSINVSGRITKYQPWWNSVWNDH
jgi:hypothetical protein